MSGVVSTGEVPRSVSVLENGQVNDDGSQMRILSAVAPIERSA